MNKYFQLDKRGQGSLEYLLLIGGAVLVAAIVIGLVVTSSQTTGQTINISTAGNANCTSKTTYATCVGATGCIPVNSEGAQISTATSFSRCAYGGGATSIGGPTVDYDQPIIDSFYVSEVFEGIENPIARGGTITVLHNPQKAYLRASDDVGISSFVITFVQENFKGDSLDSQSCDFLSSGSLPATSIDTVCSVDLKYDMDVQTINVYATVWDASGKSATVEQNFLPSLAECPRVDAFINNQWVEVGRAIKYNRGVDQNRQWDIELTAPAQKFRLVEDEPEVSHVYWIKGDGKDWGLGKVTTTPASYFGATDGSVHEFEFDSPVTKLETHGYYDYFEK